MALPILPSAQTGASGAEPRGEGPRLAPVPDTTAPGITQGSFPSGTGADDSLERVLRHLGEIPTLLPGAPLSGALNAGDRIGKFQIVGELGSGGFGAVYRALDTALGRHVALKIIHLREATSPASLARFVELFKREAETAAHLSHSNIVTLFDYGTWEELPYLVMELLDGETLQARLDRPLPRAEAVRIATEVARGLAYAHEKGIVHRDLKPGNIFLTRAGGVKVLDLGLARVSSVLETFEASPLLLEPTVVAHPARGPLTSLFAGAGTPAYMAPEQCRLEPQDKRADVFSLGVILYLLLTGKLPTEPRAARPGQLAQAARDWRATPLRTVVPKMPRRLAALVDRALAPTAAERFADGSALLAELVESTRPRRLRGLWMSLAAAVGAIAAIAAVTWTRPAPTAATTSAAWRHRQLTFRGDVTSPVLSPSGQQLAFVANRALWVQALTGRGTAPSLPHRLHEGTFYGGLRWSADERELLAYSWNDRQGKGLILPLNGAAPTALSGGNLAQSFWLDGTRVVVARASAKEAVVSDRRGEVQERIAIPGQYEWIQDIDGLPGHERLLYLTQQGEHYTLGVTGPRGATTRVLWEENAELSSPRWTLGGAAIIFLRMREGITEVLRLDLRGNGETPAPPVVLVGGLQTGEALSVSPDGRRFVYTREPRFSSLFTMELGASSPGLQPAPKALTRATSAAHGPALSPDGREVAFAIGEAEHADLYVVPFGGGEPQQVTSLPGWNARPAWAPGGKDLAFLSTSGGSPRLAWLSRHTSEVRVLAESRPDGEAGDLAWAPAARPYYRTPSKRGYAFFDLATGREAAPLGTVQEGFVLAARVSADGKRVASFRNLSPRVGLWLRDVETGAQRELAEGHLEPIRFSEGDRAVYASELAEVRPTARVRRVVAVPVEGGVPREVAAFPKDRFVTDVSLSADGKRLVAASSERRADAWVAEVEPGELSPRGP